MYGYASFLSFWPDVWRCMFSCCRPAKVRHGNRGNHVPGLTTVTVSTLEEVRLRLSDRSCRSVRCCATLRLTLLTTV